MIKLPQISQITQILFSFIIKHLYSSGKIGGFRGKIIIIVICKIRGKIKSFSQIMQISQIPLLIIKHFYSSVKIRAIRG